MAISEKLQSVKSVKNAIKNKLIAKGVNMNGVAFTGYASKIDEVAPVLSGDATTANVLKGKTFYSTDSSNKLTGTMTNNGAVSKTITPTTANQVYTIPQGYHDGSGKVTVAGAPTSLINGDALAEHVLKGKTFFSDSYTAKTGTMTNNGAVSKSFTPSRSSQSYTIPKGYHDGSGKVTVSAIPEKTELWSHSATTYAGQTLSLDLSGYKAVCIAVSARGGTSVCSTQYFEIGTTGYLYAGQYGTSNAFTQEIRSCNVTATGIVFGDGYEGNSKNNTKCIPRKVYGIK